MKYFLRHSVQMTIARVLNFPENWFKAEDLSQLTFQKTPAKMLKSQL